MSENSPFKSAVFEVVILNSHTVALPEKEILPFVEKAIKRVKVAATSENNTISFYAAIQKYHGAYLLMLSKAKQKELGVFQNDTIKLQLFEDTSKYGVEMPEELDAVLLSDYDAYQIFESLTAGKKRSIIYMISRYKNSQTRIDKSIVLTENLKRGIRDQKLLLKS